MFVFESWMTPSANTTACVLNLDIVFLGCLAWMRRSFLPGQLWCWATACKRGFSVEADKRREEAVYRKSARKMDRCFWATGGARRRRWGVGEGGRDMSESASVSRVAFFWYDRKDRANE